MGKIKEVIVVEGKNDAFKIKQAFDCDCFITYGYHITNRKLALLKQLHEKRGLILFLDPDVVGNKIRKKISDVIPNCKEANIPKQFAKTKYKVGIEHASVDIIKEALHHVITKEIHQETVTIAELLTLHLTNHPEAFKRRKLICDELYLGNCNFKALYKKLNMLGMRIDEVSDILERRYCGVRSNN